MKKKQLGATVIELIAVISIFATLIGIITISLLTSQAMATLDSALRIVLVDVQTQQARAVSLDTDNSANTKEYGIYFTQNSYTVFVGPSYVPTDASNFVVTLDEGLEFSNISLPSNSIIFSQKMGEVVGFDPSLRSVTIRNIQTSEQKTIQINRYGVITGVN